MDRLYKVVIAHNTTDKLCRNYRNIVTKKKIFLTTALKACNTKGFC